MNTLRKTQQRLMALVSVSLFLTLLLLTGCADEETAGFAHCFSVGDVKVKIARYAGDKEAALSLTFDDGTLDHYTVAMPELDKRGLKGTFFINGHCVGPVRPGDNHLDSLMLREMAEHGHEISNHTWSHINLTTVSLEEACHDLLRNDAAIERWTGHRPTTMSFPNNARNESLIAIARQGRVGIRTYEEGFGQIIRQTTFENSKAWIDAQIMGREWAVAMYHGMYTGYDCWKNPADLLFFWDYLLTLQTKLWIAPFCEVAAYQEERLHTTLALEQRGSQLHITSAFDLDPKLFHVPLTLCVKAYGRMQYVEIIPGETIVVDLGE